MQQLKAGTYYWIRTSLLFSDTDVYVAYWTGKYFKTVYGMLDRGPGVEVIKEIKQPK